MATVAFFKPYPFVIGQKLHINGGRRAGDWEVVDVSDRTVTLRCPLSGREFEWDHFCYLVEEREEVEWPRSD
ncbi:MAG: hypothetical protein ACUVX8_14170 [Candidatus Zipacnadales bacterium]